MSADYSSALIVRIKVPNYYFLAVVFLAAGFLAAALGAAFLATGAAVSSNQELLLVLALCPGLRVGSMA